MEVNEEQIEADKKLVERITKLLYVPAKMSLHNPDKLEDVFDESDGNISEQEDEQENGVDIAITDHQAQQTNQVATPLKLRKLTSMLEEPLNLSLDHNIPSVMSICSEFGNPNTPATRTYSRKRKANSQNKSKEPLKISFGELMAQDRQRKEPRKMSDILSTQSNVNQASVSTTSANHDQAQDLSSTSQNSFATLAFPAARPIDLPRTSNNARTAMPRLTLANLMLQMPRMNLPSLQTVQMQPCPVIIGNVVTGTNLGIRQSTQPVPKLPIPRLRQPTVYKQIRPQHTPDQPQDLTLRKQTN